MLFVAAAIISLINEYVKSYEFCYLIAILWGGISNYLMMTVGDLISLGLIVIVIINLLLENQSGLILLAIMLFFGLFYIYICSKLG